MRVFKKHPKDPLTKLRSLAKWMWTVRLDVERCATSNGKQAIPKGEQVTGFVLIQLTIINKDPEAILCYHRTPQVKEFPLMNKLAIIHYVVVLCLGVKIAHHQRNWKNGFSAHGES